MTAKRLSKLVCGASVGELASLEHIMAELAVRLCVYTCTYVCMCTHPEYLCLGDSAF